MRYSHAVAAVLATAASLHGQAVPLDRQLFDAVAGGDAKSVVSLIASGANPNATNARGSRPLMEAASRGDETILRILLERGAKVDASDREKRTSLMAAALEGHGRLAEILIGRGGEVNARDSNGRTALMLAISQCHGETVRVLWDAGADPHAQDTSGRTTKALAATGMCPTVLRAAAVSECKDISQIYTPDELRRFESRVATVLTVAKRRIEERANTIGWDPTALRRTAIVTAPTGAGCQDPFGFVAKANEQRIEMPVLAAKFIHDLLVADWWLAKNGYESKTSQYVNALKYKRPTDFPAARFPAPFAALGVRLDAAGNPVFADQRTAEEVEVLFEDTLFFLLAHEAAHIIRGDGPSTQAAESTADAFAFEMAIRARIIPTGVGTLLALQTYWTRNAADFASKSEFEIAVGGSGTHPASPSRIRFLGADLTRAADEFSLPDAVEEVFKIVGEAMTTLAARLETETSNPNLFWDALATTPAMLSPTKARAH